MNKPRLYQSLALQWDILNAIKAPDSPQKTRKIQIGCLLLFLENMRSDWREA